ncbi:MAG: helix-turn-helix domain-containing protein [Verrucomicrobiales bacterium]|nr:helix-turn-helix domain-containing protein [Verrucomicrobiales bacterium]
MSSNSSESKSGSPQRRAFKIDEAAEVLGVSHWTVRRLIKSGKLTSVRALRHHLIPSEAIDRFLEVGEINPKK